MENMTERAKGSFDIQLHTKLVTEDKLLHVRLAL